VDLRYRVSGVLAVLVALATLLDARCASADPAFTVTSSDLVAGKPIPTSLLFDQADCKGGNHSPQLSWRGAPAQTRSFAVTIFDQDAPGRGWWHWAVANIPATTTHLPGNASASGALRAMGAIESRNDFDVDGYGGPCPPPGKPHRYVVTVYALDTADLRLRQGTPALMFEHEIRTTSLATAQMTFTYGR
jgi:Raf kinase inhibitor-like YbhB/YbcL family protein